MFVRAIVSALVLMTAGLATPALAQTMPSGSAGPLPGSGDASGATAVTERERLRQDAESTTTRAREDQRRPARNRRDEGPSAEEQLTGARAAATAAGVGCEVSNGVMLGQTDVGAAYEITCASGVGYMLTAGEPPAAYNCLVVAGNAARAKAEDPTSDLATCTLPANQDAIAMVASAAREAGVNCTLDAAAWEGRTPDGKDRFEVGCAGVEGAWVEVATTGGDASRYDCIEVVTAGKTCNLSTTAEIAASLRARLGSGEPACTVEEARYIGANASGKFYEGKCAGADGVIALIDAQGAVTQSWACADASHVVGGCRLTTAAAQP